MGHAVYILRYHGLYGILKTWSVRPQGGSMKKQSAFIIASVTVLALLMNIVDMLKPQYFIKSILKCIVFLGVPLLYFYRNKKEAAKLKKLFTPKKKEVIEALLLGVFGYVLLLAGYFAAKDYVDFSNITKSLTADIGVHAGNFVYVSIYISVVNSFLEEFLFRGFAFMTLKEHVGRKTANIVSAALFAFYHIGMTFGWVKPSIFLFGFIGLWIGGMVFNFLCEKKNNLYTSWILHMFINFGINTVGFILFGIL